MCPTANSAGLINCLRQRQDRFVNNPQFYDLKLCSIYKMLWHPDSFVSRDSIIGAVGRRSGALFFALHRDYFIVTRNFTAVYLDLLPSRQITVTQNFSAIYRDWQKTRHPDTPRYRSGQAHGNSLNRRAVSLNLQHDRQFSS
jgi:hypothetical protein